MHALVVALRERLTPFYLRHHGRPPSTYVLAVLALQLPLPVLCSQLVLSWCLGSAWQLLVCLDIRAEVEALGFRSVGHPVQCAPRAMRPAC